MISDFSQQLDPRLYPDLLLRPDGLFDLTDIFNTSLAIAGVSDKIPAERYIYGIDLSAFLLADDG